MGRKQPLGYVGRKTYREPAWWATAALIMVLAIVMYLNAQMKFLENGAGIDVGAAAKSLAGLVFGSGDAADAETPRHATAGQAEELGGYSEFYTLPDGNYTVYISYNNDAYAVSKGTDGTSFVFTDGDSRVCAFGRIHDCREMETEAAIKSIVVTSKNTEKTVPGYYGYHSMMHNDMTATDHIFENPSNIGIIIELQIYDTMTERLTAVADSVSFMVLAAGQETAAPAETKKTTEADNAAGQYRRPESLVPTPAV